MAIKEIARIMQTHCEGCAVAETIRQQHGVSKQDQYCRNVCNIGKKLQDIALESEHGKIIKQGRDLDQTTYEAARAKGLNDTQICSRFKIAKNTLYRRKRRWGLTRSRTEKRGNTIDQKGKTKQDYLDLKLMDYTDKEIARAWQVGNNTVLRWKKQNNLKGGL